MSKWWRTPAFLGAFLMMLLIGALPAHLHGERPRLRAGAATSNITPHLGTSLDGTIMQNGPATHIHDELRVGGMVIESNDTRVAIVVCDNTMIDRSVFDEAKAIIEERCGLPPSHALLSATHSHATPRALPGLSDNPLNADYNRFLARRIADVVEQSIANLEPARIGWTRFQKPEYVHNRRWFMKPGSDMGNPFGAKSDRVRMNARGENLLKPAGPVDPEVFVLSVQSKTGRPIALLANYGMHYVGGYEKGHVSADYFGRFSEKVEAFIKKDETQNQPQANRLPPFVAMMTNGTSGDVRATDLSTPPEKLKPWELIETIAESLANNIRSLYPSINYSGHLSIEMIQTELRLGVRKPDPQRLSWAREIMAKRESNSSLPATRQILNPFVYAREALALAEFPDRKAVIVQAIRIGELAIVSSPCETFAETGLAIKHGSPFAATFTIELANGADGYLPTREHHELGGYETWPARSSFLEVDAESKIRSSQLELLQRLHDSSKSR